MPDPRRISAIAGVLLASFLLPLPHAVAQDASAYAVIDSTGGKVLLAKDGSKRMAVGSLTNIATAMVVLDWLDVRKRDITENRASVSRVAGAQGADASSDPEISFS